MQDYAVTATAHGGPLPSDDHARVLSVARPDDPDLRRVSLVGDTYTVLVSSADTQGRYCLIDMLVPSGGGPPPHRHDFEEAFTLLEGELAFTCRGETIKVSAPATVNIPANAPHQFKNVSDRTAHLLCLCVPGGQDEFFMAVGVPVASRDARPPDLSVDEKAAKGKLVEELAPKYRTEMLETAR